MPMTIRASLVLALSTIFLAGCGGDSAGDTAGDRPAAEATSECTERDGAWFGRRADGTGIISQTQEACEERLGG